MIRKLFKFLGNALISLYTTFYDIIDSIFTGFEPDNTSDIHLRSDIFSSNIVGNEIFKVLKPMLAVTLTEIYLAIMIKLCGVIISGMYTRGYFSMLREFIMEFFKR